MKTAVVGLSIALSLAPLAAESLPPTSQIEEANTDLSPKGVSEQLDADFQALKGSLPGVKVQLHAPEKNEPYKCFNQTVLPDTAVLAIYCDPQHMVEASPTTISEAVNSTKGLSVSVTEKLTVLKLITAHELGHGVQFHEDKLNLAEFNEDSTTYELQANCIGGTLLRDIGVGREEIKDSFYFKLVGNVHNAGPDLERTAYLRGFDGKGCSTPELSAVG